MSDETDLTAVPRETEGRRADENTGKSDYEVGYRKPPKATRFPKGKSGNPGGRKKAKPIDDIRTLVDGILDEEVQVRDGAQVRTVSSLEAVLQAYRITALKGNPKSSRDFFKLAAKTGMLSKIMPESFIKMMEPGGDDGKVIRMYRAEQEELARKAPRDRSPEAPSDPTKKDRQRRQA
jgi:hypothetical protein